MSVLIASKIEAVTVFRKGASILRKAELVPQDEVFPSQVRLGGLPLALDDSSLRVSVKSEGGKALYATDFRVGLETVELTTSDVSSVEHELEDAKLQWNQIRSSVEILSRWRRQVESLQIESRPQPKPGHAPERTPHKSRAQLLEFIGEQQHKLDELLTQAKERLLEAAKLVEVCTRKKATETSAREPRPNELRKSIVVSLSTSSSDAAADSAELFVEYKIPGARWAPSYAIRLNESLSKAELVMRALVRQQTGEDWSGVQVRLSTADSLAWAELPQLDSLRVGKKQAPSAMQWRPPPTGTRQLFEDYDRAVARQTKQKEEGFSARSVSLMASVPPKEIEDDGIDALMDFDMAADLTRAGGVWDIEDESLALAAAAPLPQNQAKASIGGSEGEMRLEFAAAAPPMSRSQPLFGGLTSSSMPLPYASSIAYPSEEKVSKKRGGSGLRGSPEQVAEVIHLEEKMLQYSNLKMLSIDYPARGTLAPVSLSEQYQALLDFQQVQIKVDVVDVVTQAVKTASKIESSAPAIRHIYPSAVEGFDYIYDVSGSADILSNGQDKVVPLGLYQIDTNSRYITVPRKTPHVFREVFFKNPTLAPFLAGPIDIYIDEKYFQTVAMKTIVPKGDVRLGLGVEQSIKVSRNTHFEESTTGLIRGYSDLVHEINFEIVNNLSRFAQVEVRERVPVAEEREEIKVQVDLCDTDWKPSDFGGETVRGGYSLVVDAASSSVKKAKLKYSVRIKASDELVGGNRRES